jgi:hypothetical protein
MNRATTPTTNDAHPPFVSVPRPQGMRNGDPISVLPNAGDFGEPFQAGDAFVIYEGSDAEAGDLVYAEISGDDDPVAGFLHIINADACRLLDYDDEDITGDLAPHEIKIIGRCVAVLRGGRLFYDVRGIRPIRTPEERSAADE